MNNLRKYGRIVLLLALFGLVVAQVISMYGPKAPPKIVFKVALNRTTETVTLLQEGDPERFKGYTWSIGKPPDTATPTGPASGGAGAAGPTRAPGAWQDTSMILTCEPRHIRVEAWVTPAPDHRLLLHLEIANAEPMTLRLTDPGYRSAIQTLPPPTLAPVPPTPPAPPAPPPAPDLRPFPPATAKPPVFEWDLPAQQAPRSLTIELKQAAP